MSSSNICYNPECENEWQGVYGDGHCPRCYSDFTENLDLSLDTRQRDEPRQREAPDPDEGDIHEQSRITFTTIGPNTITFEGHFLSPNSPRDGSRAPGGPQGVAGALGGFFSHMHEAQHHHTHDHPFAQRQQPQNVPLALPTLVQIMNSMFPFPPDSEGDQHNHGAGMPQHTDFLGTYLRNFLPALMHNPGDVAFSDEHLDRLVEQIASQFGGPQGNAAPPADEHAIASLPKRKVDATMLDENGKAACTICLDDVVIGQEVTRLYCSHWFHEDCIGAWLSSHNNCPQCRCSIEEGKSMPESSRARTPDLSGASTPDFTRSQSHHSLTDAIRRRLSHERRSGARVAISPSSPDPQTSWSGLSRRQSASRPQASQEPPPLVRADTHSSSRSGSSRRTSNSNIGDSSRHFSVTDRVRSWMHPNQQSRRPGGS